MGRDPKGAPSLTEQINELALVIADQAQAIGNGSLIGSRHAAAARVRGNAETLVAWTLIEQEGGAVSECRHCGAMITKRGDLWVNSINSESCGITGPGRAVGVGAIRFGRHEPRGS